jgi:hypothetical protein
MLVAAVIQTCRLELLQVPAIEYCNTELFGNRKIERWYLSPC